MVFKLFVVVNRNLNFFRVILLICICFIKMVELRHMFNCHEELVVMPFQVQNLIERCLQLYMNQKEVVDTLLEQAKIEPGFTELGSHSSTLFFFTQISI